MKVKEGKTRIGIRNDLCCADCHQCPQLCPPRWLIELLILAEKKQKEEVLKTETFHYNAVSDGKKLIYIDDDEVLDYGKTGILDPQKVSYYNLFINGVLQPPALYKVSKGVLTLNCNEPPIKGAAIILQFVKVLRGS
ncbi:DUF4183 domain-containing protein [Neobacillus sp. SM06]|uniref:DUF4183 domain-containing protein n=1 Tax=Neobacillus sp. SM06 TaxID=3422492 RepID=UPI003D2CBE58